MRHITAEYDAYSGGALPDCTGPGRRLDSKKSPATPSGTTGAEPQLLRMIMESPVDQHDTDTAQELLRTERRRDTRV